MPSGGLKADPARSRSFSRRALAILCLVVLAFAVTAATAASETRPQELWQAYPLDPQQARDAAPTPSPAPRPAARTTREAQAPPTAKRADTNLLEIAALALVALLGTGVIVLRFSRQRSPARAGGPKVPAGLLPPPTPAPALNPARRSIPIRDFVAVVDGGVAEASESTTPPAPLGLPAPPKRRLPERFFERDGTDTSPGPAAADPGAEAAEPEVERSTEPAPGGLESDAAENGRQQTASRAVPAPARAPDEAARRDSGATTSADIASVGSNASPASAAPAKGRPPRETAETAREPRRPLERPPGGLEDWRAAAEAESSAEPPEPKPDRSVPDARSSRQPLSGPEALPSSNRPRSSPDARPPSDRPGAGHPPHNGPGSDPDARPPSKRPRSGPEEWRDAAEPESKAEPRREPEHDRSTSGTRGSTDRAASRVGPPSGANADSRKNKPTPDAHTAGALEARERTASKPASLARPLQRCAIVCHRSGPTAQFAVVAVEGDSRDGPRTAWSPSFAVSPAGAVSHDRRARTAHDALVAQLAAVGWRQEESGGDWYEAVFVRDLPDGSGTSVDRATVVCGRLGREARFEAVQLDDYGNPTRLAASPPFSTGRRGTVRPTTEARALHDVLVRYLRRLGWEADQPSGDWYATPLARERS
jgi:hypothetical protein